MAKHSEKTNIDCTNWDPVATIHRKGCGHVDGRKVATRAIVHLALGKEHEELTQMLRCGYEVRLCATGKSDEFIRIYPCVSTDLKRMYPAAATMGDWRQTCLADKRVSFMRGGKTLSADEVVGEMLEAKPSDEETEKPDTIEFDEVTPDVIVTCGRCGHHIRVGRKQ